MLRGYQQDAICNLRHAVKAKFSRIVIHAPTGAGKTVIASDIINSALKKGNRVSFLVPFISLVDQTAAKFYEAGIRHMGIIQSDHPLYDSSAPVQICSIDTLCRRHYRPKSEIVIVDECHRRSLFVNKWIEDSPETLFVGLSATPWAKGMGKNWDHVVPTTDLTELINAGYLSPFRVYAPSAPDLSNLKTVRGDYDNTELGHRMCKPKLVANVVEQWLRIGDGRPTICYCVNRAHAKALSERFTEADVSTAYVDANTPMETRKEIEVGFHDGSIRVICNIGVLTTGIDWDVRCVILARPTKSEMLFVQMIGRGLRTAEGKDDCLIIDHSDSHSTLGFVTDMQRYELDNGDTKKAAKKNPKEERLPTVCSECQYVKPAGVYICPSCGHEPKAFDNTRYVDGELVAITNEKGFSKSQVIDYYRMFLFYANEKSKKEAWAWYAIKEMCGEEPMDRTRSLLVPDEKVINFIKYKNIRYAKRRR